ncbi:MAG: ribosome-associated translation inhibitor RaiA [Pseudomonadota bacterium]
MNLTVTGRHLDVTSSLRNYIDEKMDRLERHFDSVTNIHVILSVEKLRQRAEATINLTGGRIFADTVDEDMYAAIDLLTDKLDRQVIKHKEKIKDHHKRDKAPQH